MVWVVLGVVLEQVEAVAKPLLVPVLKKPPPGPPKPPPGQFSSCVKSYTNYFWTGSLIKGREYIHLLSQVWQCNKPWYVDRDSVVLD